MSSGQLQVAFCKMYVIALATSSCLFATMCQQKVLTECVLINQTLQENCPVAMVGEQLSLQPWLTTVCPLPRWRSASWCIPQSCHLGNRAPLWRGFYPKVWGKYLPSSLLCTGMKTHPMVKSWLHVIMMLPLV